VHWFDPHSEYVDHEDQHWADGYDGWLRTQLEYDNLERNRQMLDAADMKYVLDVYDEETAFTDEQIGRVLDALDERGLTEKTLIVLCVDHGEQFLEHGGFGHTTTLYDELIRVPLIVVPPGSKAGSRRADVVETCAVFGTVLGALGIQSADGVDQRWSAHQAHSLLTLPRDPAEPAFSIVWLPDSKASSGKQLCLSAIRSGRWKLVRDWTRGKRELTDRSGDQPELSARLSQELDDWTKRQREIGGEASRRTLDANTAAALRNLGYLGDDKQ
jgi:arylsulfatase A-like enzyme